MAEDWGQLVRELKSLRQKRGLTLQALARCPGLLRALNTPPLQEGYDQLCRLIEHLGSDERVVALRTAYAIGMEQPRLLMDRRTDLHRHTGRDPKTIATYEDQMIEELASRILGSTKPEVSDSQVVVVGWLDGDHLKRVTVTVRFPPKPDGDGLERTVDYDNQSKNRSMPALLYQLPHDWEPQTLTLTVVSLEAEPSLRFWAAPARELLDLMFASNGGEIPVLAGQASIEVTGPKAGVIYAVYWTGKGPVEEGS